MLNVSSSETTSNSLVKPSAAANARAGYTETLQHLSALSVQHFSDPFTDIDWDAPTHQVHPNDPRFCIDPNSPLAQTAWYAGLPAAERARFGLSWTAQTLKYGIGFEAVLSRGLLEFCQTVPDRSPEYRYAMHEVIEEGRHSLMFQEFINRTGLQTKPVSGLAAWVDDRVAHLGRSQPVLLFFAVLSGELFIDQHNRAELKRPREQVHPLLRQILKIHVMEEARHVCFAERYLQEHLPSLRSRDRLWMGCLVPTTFADAARIMLTPDARLVGEFRIPKQALQHAFGPGSAHRRAVWQATQSVRELCAQHGLMQPLHAALWRRVFLPE